MMSDLLVNLHNQMGRAKIFLMMCVAHNKFRIDRAYMMRNWVSSENYELNSRVFLIPECRSDKTIDVPIHCNNFRLFYYDEFKN